MTMSDLPAPLVPAEVDLRDFGFTPVYRGRLFGSSFHARVSDAAWRAGVTLWLKSWDQVPAGTLPDDEVDLCRLAELGRDVKAWRKIAREALHGWFKCSDGRMHHKTVAEGVMEAWNRKLAQRSRTEEARKAKLAKRRSQAAEAVPTETVEPSVTETVTEPVARSVTETVTRSKGQGQGQGQGESPLSPPDGGHLPQPKGSRGKPKGDPLPGDWTPKPAHYEAAAKLGRDRSWVDDEAEGMRAWAAAEAHRSITRKANWDQAFHNRLRESAKRFRPGGPPTGPRLVHGLANGVSANRSTSGPSSARAGITAALAAHRGDLP